MIYDETLVAIKRLAPNQYQVIELPRRSDFTTQSHPFQTRSDAQDHIEENWTEGRYLPVNPEDIEEEIKQRKTLHSF